MRHAYTARPATQGPGVPYPTENQTLDELAGEPLLMREEGSTTRKALEDALHEHKIKVNVAMEIGSRGALRESVARGLGVGTVSEYVPDPRLRVVRIQNEPVWTQIHVCMSVVSRAWWPLSLRPSPIIKAPWPATTWHKKAGLNAPPCLSVLIQHPRRIRAFRPVPNVPEFLE